MIAFIYIITFLIMGCLLGFGPIGWLVGSIATFIFYILFADGR